MAHYTSKQKKQALKHMQSPDFMGISKLSKHLNIPESTLYKWRTEAKLKGFSIPRARHHVADDWDGRAKLAAIITTAPMNQAELSVYCREHGLYEDQIKQWQEDLSDSLNQSKQNQTQIKREIKQLEQSHRKLQLELLRKDKALAETAALLILSKKYSGLLEGEDE